MVIHPAEPTVSETQTFLPVAAKIGTRIGRKALWHGSSCTWEVVVPDPAAPSRGHGIRSQAPGHLYQGTAGVALFLAELFRLTGDPEFRRAASGAIRFALAWSETTELKAGFHTGSVGVAYSAIRVGELLERADFVEAGSALLRALATRAITDRSLDVIAGSAGVIPVVLALSSRVGAADITSWAVRLGQHLVRSAHFEPIGWSWNLMRHRCRRNPTGLAHGASGVGAALLELAHVTGRVEFRYAAEQAFLYEGQFFDPVQENWPDFRHFGADEIFQGTFNEVRERLLRDGPPPKEEPRFQTTWCHGAVGIALTRLRAYELTRSPTYLGEAQAAVRTTVSATRRAHSSWCLCHGFAANCEVLDFAARVFGEESLRRLAEAKLLTGIEQYEHRGIPWPSGTVGSLPDPSLMVGDAGVGYTLLRFIDPTIPSVLLPTPTARGLPCPSDTPEQTALRRHYLSTFFGQILEVIRRLDGEELPIPREMAHRHGEVAAALAAIERRIGCELDGTRRTRLEDAVRVERERYRLTLQIDDFMEATFADLQKPEPAALASADRVIRLAPECRFVETTYDWRAWLASDAGGEPGGEPAPASWLLYRRGNRVHAKRLSTFAEIVLRSVADHGPETTREAVARIRGSSALQGTLRAEAVAVAAVRQLEEAAAAGILRVQAREQDVAEPR